MKKIFATILITILLIPAAIVLAQDSADTKTLDEIFKRVEQQDLENIKDEKLKKHFIYGESLPSVKDEVYFTDLYSSLAKIFLGVATLLIFVGLIVAGVMLVAGGGEEGTPTKAKQILKYIAIGVIIMAAAYAIVTGLTRLRPF